MYKTARAFTIVELLIVIVVIAILAAISIVAYNGIQDRARNSAAQSAARQVSSTLAAYAIERDEQYPADRAALGALGFTDGDTTYQYRANNSASPATYCATITVGDKSYFVSSTQSSPAQGACPGDGVGGVAAITNLALNPRATAGTSVEWQLRYGQTRSWITAASDGPTADLNSYARFTQASAATGGGRGVDFGGNVEPGVASANSSWPVTAGVPITVSVYMRSSVANNAAGLVARIHNGSGAWLSGRSGASTVAYTTPGQWVRLSYTLTPTHTGYVHLGAWLHHSATWPAGATIDATGLMITEGTALHAYADGSSPNWLWNGAPHASSSSGPAL